MFGVAIGPAMNGKVIKGETQALIARMTTKPSQARIVLIDALITSLMDGGVWTKLDALYLTAAHTAQAAQLNWKSSNFTLTPVNDPTFTTDRGYAGNATSSYLNTNYTITTDGSFAQNNGSLGVWVNQNVTDVTTYIEIGTSRNLISARTAGLNLSLRSASTSSDSVSVASAIGHSMFSRDNSANFVGYKNGASVGTLTRASASLTAQDVYIGARNNAGVADSFSNRRIGAAHIGVALSGSEVTTLYNALNTYLTALGAAS